MILQTIPNFYTLCHTL